MKRKIILILAIVLIGFTSASVPQQVHNQTKSNSNVEVKVSSPKSTVMRNNLISDNAIQLLTTEVHNLYDEARQDILLLAEYSDSTYKPVMVKQAKIAEKTTKGLFIATGIFLLLTVVLLHYQKISTGIFFGIISCILIVFCAENVQNLFISENPEILIIAEIKEMLISLLNK